MRMMLSAQQNRKFNFHKSTHRRETTNWQTRIRHSQPSEIDTNSQRQQNRSTINDCKLICACVRGRCNYLHTMDACMDRIEKALKPIFGPFRFNGGQRSVFGDHRNIDWNLPWVLVWRVCERHCALHKLLGDAFNLANFFVSSPTDGATSLWNANIHFNFISRKDLLPGEWRADFISRWARFYSDYPHGWATASASPSYLLFFFFFSLLFSFDISIWCTYRLDYYCILLLLFVTAGKPTAKFMIFISDIKCAATKISHFSQ